MTDYCYKPGICPKNGSSVYESSVQEQLWYWWNVCLADGTAGLLMKVKFPTAWRNMEVPVTVHGQGSVPLH